MKHVYSFNEGNKDMKDILGGKGANISEMINLGIPVPNGFTIISDVCNIYYDNDQKLTDEILKEIDEKLEELENKTNKKLGDPNNPLLVSVRSGARVSMPGMMDTVLNIGMNDEIASSFKQITNNGRFVYDSYRRFISMFADVVKSHKKEDYEKILEQFKNKKEIKEDNELTEEHLKEIINEYKNEYKIKENEEFPENPKEQLLETIKGVFRSWNNERAIYYRKMNNIDDKWGTAVNIQQMVFGNLNKESGTGVAFTRNPSTGEKGLYGEYLMNAQGEDVVSGVRTPKPINTLETTMPEIYKEFTSLTEKLEKHYKDMQDMEFTIENGKLYFLQTRNGKRTTKAAINIVVDMVEEKLITKEEAILRIDPNSLNNLLHPVLEDKNEKPITKGLNASPGAAVGKLCFSAQDAVIRKAKGEKDLILVRLDTTPEDIEGMNIVNGVLTIRGGMTSHAAVVARGIGTPCVSGCSNLVINEEEKTLKLDDKIYKEDDYFSIDGNNGNVYNMKLEVKDEELKEEYLTFMKWIDEIKALDVRANVDTVEEAEIAMKFGVEGIGLSRTEHMFFDKDRIFQIRKLIISKNEDQKQEALMKLLKFQQKDFEEIFSVMKDKPVTIRYLDPPLHEFLPKEKEEIKNLAEELNIKVEEINKDIKDLHETNPMMGHRGCRLLISNPEIIKMQTMAIVNAALKTNSNPELMIPLIGSTEEFLYLKNIVLKVIKDLTNENNYKIGTMIEVPRAAINAYEIANEADFFSFGTNDLTQMTYGFSRDDASKFLKNYYDKKIFKNDPFEILDQDGVGKLIEIAKTLGKASNPKLKIGICGEHGGEPSSIEFFHKQNLDYVSCSPYRIPIAKLAAAQAKLKEERKK